MRRAVVGSRLAPPRFAFGYAWRSRESRRRSVPGVAHFGEDGLVTPAKYSSPTIILNDYASLGYAWRSHESRRRSVPGVAHLGEDGPRHPKFSIVISMRRSLPRKSRRPLFHEARHAFAEIAAAQCHHHLAVGVDGCLSKRLERHIVKLPLDHGDRTRRDEIGKISRIGISLFAQLVGRIQPIDQTDPQCFIA